MSKRDFSILEKVKKDISFLMDCFEEVLRDLGEENLVSFLPFKGILVKIGTKHTEEIYE